VPFQVVPGEDSLAPESKLRERADGVKMKEGMFKHGGFLFPYSTLSDLAATEKLFFMMPKQTAA
jgi:hypothetical protein